MKRLKKILLFVLLLVPLYFVNASGISVSYTSLTIDVGSSKTFKITASNAAGRIDISTSDKSVATISSTSQFLDNSSASIKVTGKKEGTATITIKLTDVATYDGKILSGSKTIKVTVKKPTPKVVVPKVMKITNIDVVGYNIDFDVNKKEYDIDVYKNVDQVYVLVEGENYTATNNKIVNIKDKDKLIITLKNGDDIKEYTINIHRVNGTADNNDTTVYKCEDTTTVIEKTIDSKKFKYVSIGLSVLCLLLMIMIIQRGSKIKKLNKELESKNNIQITPTPNLITTPQVNSIPQAQNEVTINKDLF